MIFFLSVLVFVMAQKKKSYMLFRTGFKPLMTSGVGVSGLTVLALHHSIVLLLPEADIPQMKDSSNQLKNRVLLVHWQTHHRHRPLHVHRCVTHTFKQTGGQIDGQTGGHPCLHHGVREVLFVVDILHRVGSRLVQVVVVIRSGDAQVLPLLPAGPAQQLTSHMRSHRWVRVQQTATATGSGGFYQKSPDWRTYQDPALKPMNDRFNQEWFAVTFSSFSWKQLCCKITSTQFKICEFVTSTELLNHS